MFTGGGSRSELWLQIHANVIGRPLLRLATPQPTALGAAICAAAGTAAFPDLPSAAAAMSKVVHGAQPDPTSQQVYEASFRSYLATTQALAPRP